MVVLWVKKKERAVGQAHEGSKSKTYSLGSSVTSRVYVA